ncbi:hypothetical protein ACHAXH_003074 [Discostella pseudostelligera]
MVEVEENNDELNLTKDGIEILDPNISFASSADTHRMTSKKNYLVKETHTTNPMKAETDVEGTAAAPAPAPASAAADANGGGDNAVEAPQQPQPQIANEQQQAPFDRQGQKGDGDAKIVEAVGVPVTRPEVMDDDISSLHYGVSVQDNINNHKYKHAGGDGNGAGAGGDVIEEHNEEEFDYYDEEVQQLRAVRRRNVLIIIMLLTFLGLVVAISVGIGLAVVANKKNGGSGGDGSNAVVGEGTGDGEGGESMPSSAPSYEGPCIPIEIGIIFDQYPEETGWFLVKGEYNPGNPDSATLEEDAILWSSKYYDPLDYAEHSDTFDNCAMPGTYTFVFTDTEADGVCCYHGQGSYILSSEGSVITIGGEMDSTEEIITFELPFEEPEPVDTDGDGMDDRLGWMMPIDSSTLTEGVDCENFHLVILTDKYGIETTWELYEGTDKAGTLIANGGPYGSEYTYVVDYCLPSPMEYVLYLYDWDRRGLCCASGEGMYKIVSGDILIYESDGQFGEVNITQFMLPADGSAKITNEPITSMPSIYPTTLSPAPSSTIVITRPPKSPTTSPSDSPTTPP